MTEQNPVAEATINQETLEQANQLTEKIIGLLEDQPGVVGFQALHSTLLTLTKYFVQQGKSEFACETAIMIGITSALSNGMAAMQAAACATGIAAGWEKGNQNDEQVH